MEGLGEIYRKLDPKERSAHILGQIFWIPAYEHMQSCHVMRVSKYWDRTKDITTATFDIEKKNINTLGATSDLYHHMPIPELKLQMNEELVVKKVKRRPAVLVIRDGLNARKQAGKLTRPGMTVNPSSHVFAPILSLRKEQNVGSDYPSDFIEKIKSGELPEFLHLPAEGTVLRNESMALFSHLQTHESMLVEETDLCLQPLYFATALELFWENLEARILAE